LSWTIPQFFFGIAVMNMLFTGYIFYRVPEFLYRFKIWGSSLG
jgi:hypothetical protein